MIRGERVLLRALAPEDYPRLTVFKNDIEFELLGGGDPPGHAPWPPSPRSSTS